MDCVGLRSFAVFGLLAPASARADHHHGMEAAKTESTTFGVGLSLVAAQFDTMFYGGDYQGFIPSVQWSVGRFAAAADLGVYRLHENGRSLYGVSDAIARSQVLVIARGGAAAGVGVGVSAPTGSERDGLGMGHAMVMPTAWARWRNATIGVGGSAGYSGAFDTANHAHGAWPLVDPMNVSELTWSAGGDAALADDLRVGGSLHGAVAIGDGTSRVVVGARVVWRAGRIDSAFEIQSGIVGDPYKLRGVVETLVRF